MRALLLPFGLLLVGGLCHCGSTGCGSASQNQMAGPPEKENVLTAGHADRLSVARVGTVLAVELRGKPSTGYEWKFHGGGNDVLLTLGEPQFRLLGSAEHVEQSGLYTFRFRALKAGNGVLSFRYARSWEKDGDADVVNFRVRVTP